VAIHANTHATLLADLLKQLVDEAIIAGFAKISPPAALAVAIKGVQRLLRIVERIQKLITELRAIVHGLAKTIAATGFTIAAFQRAFPPADNYHSWVRGRN
jgi:hypothetical protein